MEKNKEDDFTEKEKKIIFRITALVIVLIVILGCIFYAFTHSTHHSYNDIRILGKSVEEVETIYGKFDMKKDVNESDASIICGYHVEKNIWDYIFGDQGDYYVIYFNSDGIAEKIEMWPYYYD